MPAVTTITEADLATYVHRRMGSFATNLGLTVEADSYDEVVQNALAEYGVDTVEEIDGTLQVLFLKACAMFYAWTLIVDLTDTRMNVSDAGSSVALSQQNEQARKSAASAKEEMKRLRERVIRAEADGGLVAVGRVLREDDPYTDADAEAETSDEFSG